MNGFKLTALKYAESTIDESSVFRNGNKGRIWPISMFLFLFETGNRKILVDTGCNELGGFFLSRFIAPVELLRKYGVNKKEITDVIITHSHHDHIALVSEFENATVYIQENEYETGKGYIKDGMKVVKFQEEIQVAENIRAVCIGGHTRGSCVVEFEYDGKNFVIAGDECYSKQCVLRKIPTGVSVNIDKSRLFIEKYGDADYTVFYSHDMDILPSRNGYERIL